MRCRRRRRRVTAGSAVRGGADPPAAPAGSSAVPALPAARLGKGSGGDGRGGRSGGTGAWRGAAPRPPPWGRRAAAVRERRCRGRARAGGPREGPRWNEQLGQGREVRQRGAVLTLEAAVLPKASCGLGGFSPCAWPLCAHAALCFVYFWQRF